MAFAIVFCGKIKKKKQQYLGIKKALPVLKKG